MAIIEHFRDWQSVSATVKRKTSVFDPSTGRQTESDSTIGTFDCIYWTGSQAESIVSSKIRTQISGVTVFDYDKDIKQRDTIELNSRKYSVIDVDNVSYQNEAIVVAIEEIT